MTKNLKTYLAKAKKEKFAIGQFNLSDFTELKAITEAAANLQAPVILGTSEGESAFFGIEEAVALRNAIRKKTGAVIFLNLDHGKSFEYLKKALDAGYDMVHFDGSKLPFEENIRITREVIKYAKKKGILVEGEIGNIATDSSKVYTEKFEIKEENLTKPEQALEYIMKTGVNLLAVSIGNFHGIEASGTDPHLRLDVLQKIMAAVAGKAQLVLHGGSGTPESDIKQAVTMGIAKININTELRIAFAGALRKTLADNPEEIVPYKFLLAPKTATKAVVEQKIKLFLSENKA